MHLCQKHGNIFFQLVASLFMFIVGPLAKKVAFLKIRGGGCLCLCVCCCCCCCCYPDNKQWSLKISGEALCVLVLVVVVYADFLDFFQAVHVIFSTL